MAVWWWALVSFAAAAGTVGAPPCSGVVPAPYAEDARATTGTVLVVYKSEFHLGLYRDGALVSIEGRPACFPVAMGKSPQGPKTRRDLASTPEGWYRVSSRRDVGQTSFHRGFFLDYPNGGDIDRAEALGVITAGTAASLRTARREGRLPSQGTAMGGDILIHGSGATPRDWTWGCVAMNNDEMDLVFPLVKTGDDVLILPWALP